MEDYPHGVTRRRDDPGVQAENIVSAGPSVPSIFLHDPVISRLTVVREVVRACGCRPVADEPPAATVAPSRQVAAAIVAVSGPTQTTEAALALTLLRRLKDAGIRGLAYGDEAGVWPLASRCQVLLAGAEDLVDSRPPEFRNDLEKRLRDLVRTVLRESESRNVLLGWLHDLGIVGRSDALLRMARWLRRVAPLSDLAVLLTGETGTGKELIARALHRLDRKRQRGPFVACNCGALSPGIIESELFGHTRGAFTGAERDRRGLFRAAHGGVLFLDEIGEMDPPAQTKLLRVLQESRVAGVGQDASESVDVRVIAATNRDLESAVRGTAFRADLFHRLDILSLHIPPLRDRPEDLQPLVEHFARKYRALGEGGDQTVSPEVIDALSLAPLPGNIRQLENLIRRAIINKEGDGPLQLRHLTADVWRELSTARAGANRPRPPDPETGPSSDVPSPLDREQALSAALVELLDANGWNLPRSRAICEALLVQHALARAKGNKSGAAKLLGITARTVYNKLHRSPRS